MSHPRFRDSLLEALGLWQNGWGEDQSRRLTLAEALIRETSSLPHAFVATADVCYRKRFLNLQDLKDLVKHGFIADGVTSWSKDLSTAENFKLETRPKAITSGVFRHQPLAGEVLLDVPALWADPEFRSAAESYRDRGLPGAVALFNFRDKQQEAVLNAPLRREELVALTGVTDLDFEEACKTAGVPAEKVDEGWNGLVNKDLYPEGKGVSIIRSDAAQRALARVENTLRARGEI